MCDWLFVSALQQVCKTIACQQSCEKRFRNCLSKGAIFEMEPPFDGHTRRRGEENLSTLNEHCVMQVGFSNNQNPFARCGGFQIARRGLPLSNKRRAKV